MIYLSQKKDKNNLWTNCPKVKTSPEDTREERTDMKYTTAIEQKAAEYGFGKYGHTRWDFLKEHRPETYNDLVNSGELLNHLIKVENEARERKERFTEQRKKAAGVNLQMKKDNLLLYLQKIQTIDTEVDHQIMEEIIYV